MSFMDDNFNDYFETENFPEKNTQEETPEQREERELKEATIERAHNRKRIFLVCLSLVLLLTVVIVVWSRYFHPYKESSERGVITAVTNEGVIFKTFEGEMVSEKYISDTVHIYTSDFKFTIKNDSLARLANSLKGSGRRVTVTYEEYKGKLPWRGETKIIATGISPDTIH